MIDLIFGAPESQNHYRSDLREIRQIAELESPAVTRIPQRYPMTTLSG
jgi:hypothetical protein